MPLRVQEGRQSGGVGAKPTLPCGNAPRASVDAMPAFARARPDPLDRRISPRSQTDLRARVELDGVATPCAIRDRSPGGARIVMARACVLPSAFTLIETRSGRCWRAELVWSDDRQAGVRLTEA